MDRDELKQLVTKVLDDKDSFKECQDIKNKELYIMLVNGKRIVVRSGKSVWNGKGPAKSALRNHISDVLGRKHIGRYDNMIKQSNGDKNYAETTEAIKEAEDEWIEKHVVFMPFAEWFAIQKKRKT